MSNVVSVVETIVPIFLIIAFGYMIQRKGFLKEHFIQEMNRFIFLFPLPVLIFSGIVRSNPGDVEFAHILSVLLPTVIILCVALVAGLVIGLKQGRLGSFVQTTFHGNVSYIGLAVLFYMLGEEGLKRGSILIGFLILLNNILAIAVLSWTQHQQKNILKLFLPIIKTPVIIATFCGIAVLYLKISIPGVLLKSMGILANIALPMALIIIGASITVGTIKKSFALSGVISFLKLVALPASSLVLCKLLGVPLKEVLPGVILLATPTATTSYILAREIGGNADIASGAVTLSTLASPLTFIFWASILQ
ncbi:MAG TPA: AEC family transporter [Syntrophorhabdaceae bacterium]|nr:AEC family transporter [Syntrophorhabdaceae bacterium]